MHLRSRLISLDSLLSYWYFRVSIQRQRCDRSSWCNYRLIGIRSTTLIINPSLPIRRFKISRLDLIQQDCWSCRTSHKTYQLNWKGHYHQRKHNYSRCKWSHSSIQIRRLQIFRTENRSNSYSCYLRFNPRKFILVLIFQNKHFK
jgi:hypothetical protein